MKTLQTRKLIEQAKKICSSKKAGMRQCDRTFEGYIHSMFHEQIHDVHGFGLFCPFIEGCYTHGTFDYKRL